MKLGAAAMCGRPLFGASNMPRVKLLVSRAGLNFAQAPGEVVDVGESEAKALIESGQAEKYTGVTKKKPATKAKPKADAE